MLNKYRKFITSSVGLTFLVVGSTGLFFKFFFKNHTLVQIHTWIGIGMVVSALLHIWQNRGALRNHFRDRRVYALFIPLLVVITLFIFRPEEKRIGPGQVMDKLALLKPNQLATAFGKDVNVVFAAMKKDGIQATDSSASIQDIADQNQKPPGAIIIYFLD